MSLQESLLINRVSGNGVCDTPAAVSSGGAPPVAPLRVYWQRFWLAFVFSAWGLVQSAMWNCYSPISQPIKQVYGWSDTLIGAQANTAGIAFTVTIPFWAWVIDTRGARLTSVWGCILLSICGVLRCLPVPRDWHGAVVLVSMLFNGMSAAPIALAPPILSAAWFDTGERTAATAVMTTMNCECPHPPPPHPRPPADLVHGFSPRRGSQTSGGRWASSSGRRWCRSRCRR